MIKRSLESLWLLLAVIGFFMGQAGYAHAGAQENEIIELLNNDRMTKGRKSLKVSPALTLAAESHAKDMAVKGYFSHTGQNGSTLGMRIKKQGYKFCYAAENIAWGQKSAKETMASWRKSAGHNKNNLSRKPTEVGAGFYGGNMWVLVFAKPC